MEVTRFVQASGVEWNGSTVVLALLVASGASACDLVAHTGDYAVETVTRPADGGGDAVGPDGGEPLDSAQDVSTKEDADSSGQTVDGSVDDSAAVDGSVEEGGEVDVIADAKQSDVVDATDAADAPQNSGCTPTVAVGAIATPLGYQSVMGRGGITYSYTDNAGSTACINTTVLCAAGLLGTAAGPTVWGAAFGFNLNQDMTPPGATVRAFAVPSNATGIAYQLSDFPPGVRLAIDHLGQEYCAPLPGATGSVNWRAFNTTCWNNQGAFLTAPPPDATFIHFIIPAVGTPRPFDFCAIDLHFALADAGSQDASPGDGAVGDGPGGDGP